ncbi:sigma-54-dependent transcriptional regulator [Thiothrix subterranea]|uniref:Sigma-54 dependent transcriptional regulator n=1 Tax=Thiothrix subterranea TaxID=2735563 RepID=A0AA51R2T1_9GAMM|nr:sigma-54 dependent transcriptional regulator [Thiothrix subterranea]MDQ5768693.1 sigma-54 dependent transcriptional regulator [Thiothrix subterranea]WML84845.1 sigma-54 dependent transcriptional regulator [Thiothrix subterranea]
MTDTLLIVEDDHTLRITLGEFLTRRGYSVELAENVATATALAAQQRYALILLDLHLPDGNGLELIGHLRQLDENCLVVIMTAFPEVRTAVAALKAGAYDYINKPFDLEDLLELIRRALETGSLRRELAWRRAQDRGCGLEGMVGNSLAFRQMLNIVQRIASAQRVPVLIHGESGTGKEHVARAIHCQSPRAAGPWIAVNCAALPEALLESEMFGHEKGAFTDAKQAKPGLLELADGGTLFLDEIGDLSLSLQPKLLRVLETQAFRRLGGSREIRVDVRFVAATHRDLRKMIGGGQFREDLYYRLNVGAIDVPPLRERREDILPLAQHFLQRMIPALGVPALRLAAEVVRLLDAYPWPGNIRELRNVMERAAILTPDGLISTTQLPREMLGNTCPDTGGQQETPLRLAEMEQAHIRRVLADCDGNKTRAAEVLGITRATLRNKLREHRITDGEGDEG